MKIITGIAAALVLSGAATTATAQWAVQPTPAYAEGPFLVLAIDGAEDCGPSQDAMERIVEGELLRANLETGWNEHIVAIQAETFGLKTETGLCAVVTRTSMTGNATTPDGHRVRARILYRRHISTGGRNDMPTRVRAIVRQHADEIATEILRARQQHAREAAGRRERYREYLERQMVEELGEGPHDAAEREEWYRRYVERAAEDDGPAADR